MTPEEFAESQAMLVPTTAEVNAWTDFARLEMCFYAAGDPTRARSGDVWFAAVSGVPNGELNVCGLAPGATRASALALLEVLGELPAVVFTSEHVGDDARAVLVAAGFEVASTREPLMRCRAAPKPATGPFRVAEASRQQVALARAVTAEAHHIDPAQVAATFEVAVHNRQAQVWLAWDGEEPVSAVWLAAANGTGTLGVMEMMTPSRHQRRGAGRQLLSTALAQSWTAETTQAILLSTPAGRSLYESLGFAALDEVISCVRGLDPGVLAAIGQPTG